MNKPQSTGQSKPRNAGRKQNANTTKPERKAGGLKKKIDRKPYELTVAHIEEALALLKNEPGEADENMLEQTAAILENKMTATGQRVTVWLSNGERGATLNVIDEKEAPAHLTASAKRSLERALAGAADGPRRPYGMTVEELEDLLYHLDAPSDDKELARDITHALTEQVVVEDLDRQYVLLWMNDNEKQAVVETFETKTMSDTSNRVAGYLRKRLNDHQRRRRP